MDYKKVRLLRGSMTQEELAQRSGVDKAIISKIETGKMPGTVECHRKLAGVFSMKLSEFYAFLEEEAVAPIEFHGHDAATDVYKDFLEIMTTIPLTKKMLPTFITLKPGEQGVLEETLKKVERFIIILEGEVEIDVEGSSYRLKRENKKAKGDSLYSRSPKRHRLKNSGTSIAHLLCVSSPPVL